MAVKLDVFNAALSELGDYSLSDTGERIPAARVLAARWDRVVADCISEGSWNFAMETVQIDADTGVVVSFGSRYEHVFAKPTDWVKTIEISGDPDFSNPLIDYEDKSTYFAAGLTPIYLGYVSNDTGMGLDLTRWGAAFTRYVELELAVRACMKLTQNSRLKAEISEERDKARKTAKNQDAMNERQPKFPPPSSWTSSRWGRWGGRGPLGDNGSGGSLTG